MSWTTFDRVERRLKIKTMFNFKKISAISASVLMIGMTAGIAAAASYPAPFVVGGNADVAVVYGTGSGVSVLDAVEAGNLQTNLQSFMGTGASGSTTSTSGEIVSLSSGSTKIWLNTSLSTALTTLTKTDLPTVLGAYTFSGNVDSKLTSTITIGTNKVDFAKQPSSNVDPVIGIATSSSSSSPLYNASITMPAIAFNDTNSEGESITLFGKDYVVSTATDATDLVLFSSAEEITLQKSGTENPTATVTIAGTDHVIELLNGDSTTATISIDGTSKSITEGSSKKVGGVEVAVKTVTSSTVAGITATLLVGSEKLTFTDNTQVTKGSDADPVDGTLVTFTGTTGALTGLSIAVYAPDTSNDAILAGETFTDPVFGSFKVDFSGLNVPLSSTARDTIKIDKSGDKGMSLTFTDSDTNTNTFDFVYNSTANGGTFLGDSNNYKIHNVENDSLNEDNYTMIGNEDYGHLIQVTRIYNSSSSDYSKDSATFKDVMSGDTYSMDATAEGTGRLTIDGRQYTVSYSGTGSTGTVSLKYPTSDSSATQVVVFPTIKTNNGALVSLYEPQTIDLTGLTGLKFPNGDGYTTGVIATDGVGNYTLDGVDMNSTTTGGANITVGQLKYNFGAPTSSNVTTLKLYQPGTSTLISAPSVVVFEGKDDSSNYEVIVTDVEANAAGSSSDPLGVNDVYFTSPTVYDSVQLQSDSDIVQSVDWFGTEVTEDSNTASQKVVTISYPKEQVYAQVYVGEESSVVSSSSTASASSQLGDVLVKDTEISSVSSKNLIVVGGTCINSAAANVLGGAYCGSSFTDATGVGSGQFLIESVADKYTTGKVALVVAGYDAADTVNAAKYLRTQTVDTTAGKKYKGTTSTSAELVVA